ncbi:MAG: ATP-binding cassette domain-containing protein, partial [Candidatus Nanopelagicales bacterium]
SRSPASRCARVRRASGWGFFPRHQADWITYPLVRRWHTPRSSWEVRRDADSLAILAEVGIAGLAGERMSRLSGGQRNLTYLAMALAHQPAVLLLDEPTAGLDAEHRILLREAVGRLADHLVVITATHLPDDIGVL